MKWVSHVVMAAAVTAVFNPGAVPAAVLGSTAPDWMEWVITGLRRGRKVKHRGITHYFAAWVLLAAFAWFVWDWRGWVFWFAVGGAVHWFCDALTVSGAPLGWWSDRRMTLFGGKVITGSATEYAIVAAVVLACALVIWQRADATQGGAFWPFFYNWPGLYERGLIDGHEWRTHRFNVI